MFKTILVPIDVNDIETAEPALAQAVAIAQDSDGCLRLIHVRSDIPRSVMEFVPPNFDAKRSRSAKTGWPTWRPGLACLRTGSGRDNGLGAPRGPQRSRAHWGRPDRCWSPSTLKSNVPARIERRCHRATRDLLGAGRSALAQLDLPHPNRWPSRDTVFSRLFPQITRPPIRH